METKKKIAFAATLATLLVAAAAYARPMYSITYSYYSDPSYSDHVGGAEFTCSGRMIYWGEQTPYRLEDMQMPCSSTGPELPGTGHGYP
ncbi:DUF6289 family protein [Janthinobacterium sp.]|uniref:DUF6289 family protein n=1 Tax=Janthinobacterium sp. TaxID=1871054 RepID=UPI00258413BE|nr:DUF6289 family protein [Janthinobacterium sp.]MCX7291632.1 DUF6289 family protein [Janthinobacterium sp.]